LWEEDWAEEDMVTVHEDLGCDPSQIVNYDEDIDDYECMDCKKYKTANRDKDKCQYPRCNKAT